MKGLAKGQQRLVQTPLLGRMLDSIVEDQRLVLLDLGRVSASLVAILQPYRARLDGLSIADQRSKWVAAETSNETLALIKAHLAHYDLEPSDWLLCWGVLNYLDEETLGLLFDQLQPFLKPTVRVHALIEYSAAQMPIEPPQYDICFVDGKTHLDIHPHRSEVPSPRYTPKRLEAMLHGMKTQSTILLSNGMQEFIFSKASA